jgi:osmotically-inducible protein OsmY
MARLGLCVVALFLLQVSGCASRPCAAGCQDDAAIQREVQGLLDEHDDLKAPNLITVRVQAGVVYLGGEVATELQRDNAESVARQSHHVKRLVNVIGVQNVSR